MTQPPPPAPHANYPAPPPYPPQGPYYQGPPNGSQPQPTGKPKKPVFKRWWFWLVIVIVVAIAASSTGGGKSANSTTAASPSTNESSNGSASSAPATAKSTAPAKSVAGIGTPVRDGKFEFTVTAAPDCSKKNIGGKYGTTAQGVFCILPLHVSNIGKEAQTFDDSSQTAFDAQGRKYSTDTAAGVYLDDSHSFLEQLNPGSSVDGKIVFDVPAGTQLTSIELHDSMFSGGEKVKLG